MVDFPSTLPKPQQAGYTMSAVSPFLRTEMSTGRAKQRRMFESVPTVVDVEWKMTNGQAAIFEAWFTYEIASGADWFNCVLQTPMGVIEYECRFTDMYDGPNLFAVNRWSIRAKLEIFERPILSEDWYNLTSEYFIESSIFDEAMNREWPEP